MVGKEARAAEQAKFENCLERLELLMAVEK
jgi:hypothetical protein